MKTISNNDFGILAKIFFPSNNRLFFYFNDKCKNADVNIPEEQNVVAISGQLFPNTSQLKNIEGIIALGAKPFLPDFDCRSFHFVNNPDGSIRWLYPSDISEPVFLNLYNSSGWRGFVIKKIFQSAFWGGAKNWIKSGTVHVFYKNKIVLDDLFEKYAINQYAIFTGTAGDDRKTVLALKNKNGAIWYYKIPLTQSAEKLVQNELSTLQFLNGFSFSKMDFPQAEAIGDGLMQSSVAQLKKYRNSFVLEPVHLEAIKELNKYTSEMVCLKDLPFWEESSQNINVLEEQPVLNNMSVNTVKKIIERLRMLRASIDPFMEIPTLIAHGDFTPWNMYLGKGKLYVYDWEFSERLPLLFDAFHFIVQSGVLIKRLPFSKIEEEIKALEKDKIIEGVLENQPVHFKTLYQLYLLKNISYYMLKYIRQHDLHEQAHWLLEAWVGLLLNAISEYKTQPI